jgi:hypothetical protein
MGDDDYLEIPLTASGMSTELGDPIREHNSDEMTAPPSSAERQSINQPTQVDGPTNNELASFIEEHHESRRTSDADTIKTYHQGIYWRSPITMVTFFFLGIFISVCHHLYYNSLEGQVVNDQEWVIRSVTTSREFLFHIQSSVDEGEATSVFKKEPFLPFSYRYGTTFAFFAQVSLVTSVGFAFTQVLWRTLKNTEFSIQGIDAAFNVRSTLLSFFNLEVLWKMKVGSLLALIAW